jgi:hypothetical protein
MRRSQAGLSKGLLYQFRSALQAVGPRYDWQWQFNDALCPRLRRFVRRATKGHCFGRAFSDCTLSPELLFLPRCRLPVEGRMQMRGSTRYGVTSEAETGENINESVVGAPASGFRVTSSNPVAERDGGVEDLWPVVILLYPVYLVLYSRRSVVQYTVAPPVVTGQPLFHFFAFASYSSLPN